MLRPPHRALAATVAVLAWVGGPTAAPARAPARPWATVNLCDPPERPGAVGVRVGMPAGPGSQWMRVRIEYYDAAAGRYHPATAGGDGGWTRLGAGRVGVRGGTTFPFAVPAAGRMLVMRGIVDLEWRRGARVARKSIVRTSAGHGAESGGVSRAECIVRR